MSFSEILKSHYSQILQDIFEQDLYKYEHKIVSPQGVLLRVKGSGEEVPLLNFCANNYLGLSSHPEILAAAHQGLEERGFGMSSVRFICGTQDLHMELEEKMSQFLGTESTILFSSCFDANGALFESLLTQEDIIFSDQLVHASLIDGMRLCRAHRHVYRHSDMNHLEQLLQTHQGGVRMIVTDGVFSMDGDMAPLGDLVHLAKKYQTLLVMDDSHATGFIGPNGRGTHEHFSLLQEVDLLTTTFGKALGGATGGCISGRKELIQVLRQRARPYLFSNALMPAVVKATLKALELVVLHPEQRDHLQQLTKLWRSGLEDLGFEVKAGSTPIVPIMMYEASIAQAFSRELFGEGILAVGFSYPVVPRGEARIRTQISAAMEEIQIQKALESFQRVAHCTGLNLRRKSPRNRSNTTKTS